MAQAVLRHTRIDIELIEADYHEQGDKFYGKFQREATNSELFKAFIQANKEAIDDMDALDAIEEELLTQGTGMKVLTQVVATTAGVAPLEKPDEENKLETHKSGEVAEFSGSATEATLANTFGQAPHRHWGC